MAWNRAQQPWRSGRRTTPTWLRPKQAIGVAGELLDAFTMFGVSSWVSCDGAREFHRGSGEACLSLDASGHFVSIPLTTQQDKAP